MTKLKIIALALIIIIVLTCGGYILKTVLLPVKTVTTQIDSAGNIIDKTYDADNAIYNYEWFKNRYESIKATEKQIDNTIMEMDNYKEMYGNPMNWSWQQQQAYDRMQKTKLGQINYYEEIVAEYNARSKMANRNIFKDKLPLYVDEMLW